MIGRSRGLFSGCVFESNRRERRMKVTEKRKKRKISAGTIFMIACALVVLGAAFFAMDRLSSVSVIDQNPAGKVAGKPDASRNPEESGEKAEPAAEEERERKNTALPQDTITPPDRNSFTFTVLGTTALTGEVRTNSYYSDVKQYDYYDILTLLRPQLKTDLNIVFFENILSTDGKKSDTLSTGAAAAMLNAAGIRMAACGFSKAYEKSGDGIVSTKTILGEYGIQTLGICEKEASDQVQIREINGVKAAFLQYTDTIPETTRKKMKQQESTYMIPPADPDLIASDIQRAREMGSETVIVLVQWGKTGKAPDKNQHDLAQKVADAGADLIIGCGSRIVSGGELLTAKDTGRNVMCIWSLGTTLSGDRGNIKRIAGMMLHVTVEVKKGNAPSVRCTYTPLYTWKYKMDGRYYYRCLPANGAIPDGMDTEQQKMMKKAAETVRSAMKDTSVEEEEVE